MKNHTNVGGKAGSPVYRTPTTFTQRVFAIVAKIPKGKTLTYKEVAQRAGFPKAYRAVGNALNKNYDQSIPCHRVVKSNGEVGEYNRGVAEKKRLLKKEQLEINEIK